MLPKSCAMTSTSATKRPEKRKYVVEEDLQTNDSTMQGHLEMLTDEEDEDSAFVRYRVFKKAWRHARVTKFLRILDALHRMWRAESGQADPRGSTQRRRYLCDEEDGNRPPKPRLPKNAYDSMWLASRTQVERDKLKPRDDEYDFSHDDSIKK